MMEKSMIKRFRALLLLIYPLVLPLIFWSCATSYKEYQVSLNQHSLTAEELFSTGDNARALAN